MHFLALISIGMAVLSIAPTASAYAGFGPLIPAIGSGITLLFIIVMTLGGLLAYPITVLRNRSKSAPAKQSHAKSK